MGASLAMDGDRPVLAVSGCSTGSDRCRSRGQHPGRRRAGRCGPLPVTTNAVALVATVRGLMLGGPVRTELAWTGLRMVILLVVFVPLALRAYRHRASCAGSPTTKSLCRTGPLAFTYRYRIRCEGLFSYAVRG